MFLYALLALILVGSKANTPISDGETLSGVGSNNIYVLHIDTVNSDADIVIQLTKRWGHFDPDLYVKAGEAPTDSNYTWDSRTNGSDFLAISSSELTDQTDYYILVACNENCRYYITVSHTSEIELLEGVSLDVHLDQNYDAVYKFQVPQGANEVSIIASPKIGSIKMQVGKNALPSEDNSLPVDGYWMSGYSFYEEEPSDQDIYYVVLAALRTTDYSIMATAGYNTVIELNNNTPIGGVVDHGQFRHYKFDVLTESDLSIVLTYFSGDPDLYVRAGQKPTFIEYDFYSGNYGSDKMNITIDQRNSIGKPTGVYYIGVYGSTQSSYTLLVSDDDSDFIPIAVGVPQSGEVMYDTWEEYSFGIKDQMQHNITVYLTPESGDPDLFLKLCKAEDKSDCHFTKEQISNPSEYGILFSQHTSGSETLGLVHKGEDCEYTERCLYVVAVYGSSEVTSKYSLRLINSNDNELILQDGHPLSLAVAENNYVYFMYTVHNMTVSNLTVTLTPVSGQPDLYVSRLEMPSITNYEKKSISGNTQVDSVRFERGPDGETLATNFHIAVYGVSTASFSILVSEFRPNKKTLLHIYPGLPQRDTVNNYDYGQHRLYYFINDYTEDTKADITISLTTITGHFNLYAANNVNHMDWSTSTFYYNWRGTYDSVNQRNVIHISKNDPNYLLQSTYLIFAQANSFTSDWTATYSIVYSPENTIIMLLEDIPHQDNVENGSYKHFTFPVHYFKEDLKISVTALSGDPNMYVSIDPKNPRPTKLSYDLLSINIGSEDLVIPWEEGFESKCPNLPDVYHEGDATNCPVYISVYGQTESSFSIRVHPSTNLPKLLIMEQPQAGSINATSYEYYYISFENSSPLYINVQTSIGITDLYVNILDQNTAGADSTHWDRPNTVDYDYKSEFNALGNSLEIDNLLEKCPSHTCIAMIAVHCSETYCGFTVAATQDTVETLLENTPISGVVSGGAFKYYKFYCNTVDNDMYIRLTSLTGGDPDLYVGKIWTNQTETPTIDSFDWSSKRAGSDSLLISKSDPKFQDSSIKGNYYIGVYSELGASYTILVINHPNALTKLVQGVPASNNLPPNAKAYYYYYNVFKTDLIISLTPEAGSALMTIKTVNAWGNTISNIYDNLPTLDDYIWASVESSDKGIIRIDFDDPNYCTSCDFIIGVFTSNTECDYNLLARNNLNLSVLKNGSVVKAYMKEPQTDLYSFNMYEKKPFDVVVTRYSGVPVLEVSNSLDAANGFSWKLHGEREIQHIRVVEGEENLITGTYAIQVTCYTSCSYSILEHTQDSYIKLIDGWPVSYSLRADLSDRVFFQYKSGDLVSPHLYCMLTPLNANFVPTVYVRFATTQTRDILPGPNTSTMTLNYKHYDAYNRLSFALNFEEKGIYNFGVYSNFTDMASREHSEVDLPGEFEISCSSGVQSKILTLGNSTIEYMNQDETSMKFEISVEEEGTLEVLVSPCSSKLNMMISKDWTVSDGEEPDVSVQRITDGALKGVIPNAQIGKYFITVTITEKNKYYETERLEVFSVFYAAGENPHNYLVPGEEGLVLVEELSDTLEISWAPVEYIDGSPYNNTRYSVYLTRNPDINFLTGCGIIIAESYGDAEELGTVDQVDHITVKYDLKEGPNVINVIAFVEENDNTRILAYLPALLSGHDLSDKKISMFRSFWFWILTITLTAAIVFAFVFYKMYKRTNRKLQFEMADVRNVANVRQLEAEQVSGVKNFAPLNEERPT